MGDSAAAAGGGAFIKEFGQDYRRESGLDGDRMYVVVEHGLVYDDFHREVKYGLTLRATQNPGTGEVIEVILDRPAAHDPTIGDPIGEMIRVARDLGLSPRTVFRRFKRAGLAEGVSLADFPKEDD